MPPSAELNQDPKERNLIESNVSFAALYSEHFAFVWRNLRRLGVPEGRLRDAAQDVFLVVHRRLSEFEGRGTAQAWLYSILRRVAADHRRHRRRKELHDQEPAEELADASESDPEDQAARGESLRLLLGLLAELDEDKRDILVLVDLEGMTVPEAAEAIGCNVNTAYARLRAARLEMQEGLMRQRAEEWSAP